MIYNNIVFYNGLFYTDKINIRKSYTHNRLTDNKYLFIPNDIDIIKLPHSPVKIDEIMILLDHFHYNPVHNIWDHIYPSWYRLFNHLNFDSTHQNFHFIINKPLDKIFGIQHIKLIEKISGNKPLTLSEFQNKFNKPVMIKHLITGLDGIGIGNINKNNLTVSRGLEINNADPVETFINRIYFKYNIKRNSLVDKLNINECKNVIYIKNKRVLNGIEKIFDNLNKKYKGNYNFKIIDYSKHTFEEQLHILNTTCICVVGVGSARFNTPFLPNGAIEIQTFQPNIKRKNYIEYVDCIGGTLSKYVKVKNIPYYTKEEATNNNCSHLLEQYIEDSINEIPCKVPINLEDNIPKEILDLRKHKNYEIKFDMWRKSMSNIIEHFFDMLN